MKFLLPFISVLLCPILFHSSVSGELASTPLHSYTTYEQSHQNILVIGETGSGKSTFIQFMLVSDLAKIDDSKIQVSVKSITNRTLTYKSPTFIVDDKHYSAEFFDTIGFNAEDIDGAHVFAELKENVRFTQSIHKILIVHKLGRARTAVVHETHKTIQLLKLLGAKKENVYVTITFAYDYNSGIRNKMLHEVQELYATTVHPSNVFFSEYVLLAEIDPDVRDHYEQRIRKTHEKIMKKVIVESVEPFQPVIATFHELESQVGSAGGKRSTWVKYLGHGAFGVMIVALLYIIASTLKAKDPSASFVSFLLAAVLAFLWYQF